MAATRRAGVDLRAAAGGDAADLAALLHDASPRIAARLEALAAHPFAAALVATGWTGLPCGLIVLDWAPSLQSDRPIARITTLLVAEEDRRSGIGRLLVKAGSQAARVAGCDRLDIALPPGSPEAEAFCAALGFTGPALTLSRPLRKRAPGDPG
ncbi:acetyltransferase (GNAT) family protein [Humitalea rosea]|uniref:Acetyltransferase (GNAT) family protein n=1 Tax=Humitalea rosea TaxID=990373 RepID=A0A2W7KBB9_9PROT|nr:GNAT family N-acetyltransferase [Humitalea rosea]PZW44910.1 acetyltransferase (GNAT) family protein [Humitalea rosea]